MPEIDDLLPEDDCRYLRDKFPAHVVREVGGELHVLLPAFAFPEAYRPLQANLLLRLPAGYPNAAPDMFWTQPDVMLASGAWPDACQHHEVPGSGPGSDVYQNVMWQRWSRHFEGGWIVGQHGLPFFIRTIIQELKRGV